MIGQHEILIAQNNTTTGTIGFSCSFSGMQSMEVRNMSKMIEKSEYTKILKLLDSGNNAEKYLAVLVLEKFEKLNKIEKMKVFEIYNSKELVFVCAGCTYQKGIPLHILFSENGNFGWRETTLRWLEREFEKSDNL